MVFFSLKTSRSKEVFFAILFFSQILYFVETFLALETTDKNYSQFILAGLYIQAQHNILMASRIRMTLFIPTLLGANLYLEFRIHNFLNEKSIKIPLLNVLLLIFFNLNTIWGNKTKEKEQSTREKQSVFTIGLEEEGLIKEHLPYGFLIISDNKISFMNKKISDLFEVEGDIKKLEETLDSWELNTLEEVKDADGVPKLELQGLNIKIQDLCNFSTKKESDSYRVDTESESMLEGSVSNKTLSNDFYNNASTKLFLSQKIPSNAGSPKNFEIKIVSWLNEGVVKKIIFFNEEPYLQKMIQAKTDQVYKDKLIATVSHDLRPH